MTVSDVQYTAKSDSAVQSFLHMQISPQLKTIFTIRLYKTEPEGFG